MVQYIDTHSHVHFSEFESDREEVFARMKDAGVVTIAVGTGLGTSKGAVEAAQKNPDLVVGATIGVHPTDFDEDFNPNDYEALLESGKVVGVGEFGFDYFRTPREEVFERQRELFKKQLDFAIQHDLPLMLHVRPSSGSDDAHLDALEILEEARREYGEKVRGNSHFFTGSLKMAKRYWALGFTTAFPGVITFAKETQEAVQQCPPELMLSETDSPYAAPVPHRGQRCEPAHVTDTVAKIAEIRGEDLEIVKKRLISNAVGVFGVPK